MLVIGKTQKLWNWVCYWVALLLVSVETLKTTASLIPRVSEPGEEKKKRKKVTKQLLLKWPFLEYSVQWRSWGQRWKRNISPPNPSRPGPPLILWNKIPGRWVYLYLLYHSPPRFLAHRTITGGRTSGKDQQQLQNVRMAADFGQSRGSSCPQPESSLSAPGHITDPLCKLATQKR